MKTTRLLACIALILAASGLLVGTLAVKWVPRLENEWKQAGAEIGSAQAMLVAMSHRCQTWTLVWLPGSLALGLASAALFFVSSRGESPRDPRDGEAAG